MKNTLTRVQLIPLFLLFISCQTGYKESVTGDDRLIMDDISNQQISSFAEDAHGHIWIGTFRGLNKYTGHQFYQYFNSDDSLSLSDSQIKQVFCDSKKRLWVATVNGICQYTDQDCFRRIPIENAMSRYIHQILESKDGRIFLNTAVEMLEYVPAEDKFKVALPELYHNNTFVIKCYIDGANQLWVLNPLLIRCYDLDKMELKQTYETGGRYVQNSFLRDNGELWLSSFNTLAIFDTRTGRYIETPEAIRRHPKLSEAVIENIYSYNGIHLLINTLEGFYLYNTIDQTVLHQSQNGFPFEPQFKITTLFTDSQKNLWAGSFDQGFATYYSYKEQFNSNNYLRTSVNQKSVIDIAKDGKENLWITTSMDGVLFYNMEKNQIKTVETQHFFPEKKYFHNQVKRIFVDKDNSIWLIAHSKLIRCNYDDHRNVLQQKEVFWMPNIISKMAQDKNGTLWAGCYNENIYALRPGASQFETIPLYPQGFTFTSDVITLSTGEIMVASYPYSPRLINPDTWEIRELDIYGQIKRSAFVPICLYEDSQGDIWVGTITNGLIRYVRSRGTFERMEGTTCTDISAVMEDVQGNIWTSTLFGLSKYDRATGKFVNYYKSDGIGGNQFNERSYCRLGDGTLIFGGTHGITQFNPIDIKSKRNVPLLFEDLKVHNQVIRPFRSACIDKSLTLNPDIRLRHDQNSFTLSFAALDYSEYERVHYHYIMEGFDKFWIEARNNREAYYSNLPPGCYTFRVRITNNNKSIVETENSILVHVSPAPWATWWAYCIYTFIAAVIASIIMKLINRIRKNKLQIAQAEKEKEQEQRLNKMNMSFFANVSHEFRTPLTMIAGPVTQLCNDTSIDREPKQLLYIIQRSVNRMLKLVNQLMDFNKLENDALKLKVKHTDIIAELNRLVEVFSINAASKGITLKTYGLEDSFLTWLDVDKIEKITSNLIANALKFTPGGGRIEIAFDVITYEEASSLFVLADKDASPEYIKITVTDSGSGIPEDKLEKIFERYYQLNDHSKGTYNWGTGIGLYFARRLAELHHGYIKAVNRPEGKGARIVYILPTADGAYSAEEKNLEPEKQEEAFPLQTEEQYRTPGKEETGAQPTLLVVDDDTEVINYLQALLSPHYHVIARFDGESGYKTLKEEAVDLVLSDVVMPGTSGFDLCRMIKDDLQLCHIPVVLITAKATVEDQVTGLDTGADAYVTKPFDPNYLLALLKSQLSNRERIRTLLGKATKAEKIEEDILSPQDKTFMGNLYELMENELSNSELNITRMTEVMKISRTKFYYKVKGLTGENPNVFFKTYKLNRAAELLGEGIYNVSEVADMTGFSTLSHFSASFKKRFGRTPSGG